MFLLALVFILVPINIMHTIQEYLLSLSIDLQVVFLINGSIVFCEMSQNFKSQFPWAQSDVFKKLILSYKQSKIQILFIYYHKLVRKKENPYV